MFASAPAAADDAATRFISQLIYISTYIYLVQPHYRQQEQRGYEHFSI